MKNLLKPLKADSLKEVFIARFEELILSGALGIGQKLPSERELALQLGVSRPVVHEGLIELQAKGLVSMRPRVGTVVNDYRTQGSLAILGSLVEYHRERFEPRLLNSMLAMRCLVEIETARLAALNRTDVQLHDLEKILDLEREADPLDAGRITEFDFAFHHLVAMASDNMIYPLFLNSFKEVYTSLSGRFFADPSVLPAVHTAHRALVSAIRKKDARAATHAMAGLLRHGERHLKASLAGQGGTI